MSKKEDKLLEYFMDALNRIKKCDSNRNSQEYDDAMEYLVYLTSGMKQDQLFGCFMTYINQLFNQAISNEASFFNYLLYCI